MGLQRINRDTGSLAHACLTLSSRSYAPKEAYAGEDYDDYSKEGGEVPRPPSELPAIRGAGAGSRTMKLTFGRQPHTLREVAPMPGGAPSALAFSMRTTTLMGMGASTRKQVGRYPRDWIDFPNAAPGLETPAMQGQTWLDELKDGKAPPVPGESRPLSHHSRHTNGWGPAMPPKQRPASSPHKRNVKVADWGISKKVSMTTGRLSTTMTLAKNTTLLASSSALRF